MIFFVAKMAVFSGFAAMPHEDFRAKAPPRIFVLRFYEDSGAKAPPRIFVLRFYEDSGAKAPLEDFCASATRRFQG